MASVSLKISRTETGQYLVVVNGEGFFNAVNKAVGARVRGEDTFIDDFFFRHRQRADHPGAAKRQLRPVQDGCWKRAERRLGAR